MDIKEVKHILNHVVLDNLKQHDNHFVLDKPPGYKYWVDTNYSMQYLNFAMWCNKNLSSHWYYSHQNTLIGYRYWFEKEEDKILFILKYI